MHRECQIFEDTRHQMASYTKLFEKDKAQLDEKQAQWEAEKKSDEWGDLGLKKKLKVAEDKLVEERRQWTKVCKP
ncbi:hypothetical protein Hanom_Chr04g00340291 [Helianthus anomalus]